jgi:hypothetical protein
MRQLLIDTALDTYPRLRDAPTAAGRKRRKTEEAP